MPKPEDYESFEDILKICRNVFSTYFKLEVDRKVVLMGKPFVSSSVKTGICFAKVCEQMVTDTDPLVYPNVYLTRQIFTLHLNYALFLRQVPWDVLVGTIIHEGIHIRLSEFEGHRHSPQFQEAADRYFQVKKADDYLNANIKIFKRGYKKIVADFKRFSTQMKGNWPTDLTIKDVVYERDDVNRVLLGTVLAQEKG